MHILFCKLAVYNSYKHCAIFVGISWVLPSHIHKVQNSEYDQEIPQSQIADKPVAPRGRVTQQSQDTRKTY